MLITVLVVGLNAPSAPVLPLFTCARALMRTSIANTKVNKGRARLTKGKLTRMFAPPQNAGRARLLPSRLLPSRLLPPEAPQEGEAPRERRPTASGYPAMRAPN